jgi:hypothetical protein
MRVQQGALDTEVPVTSRDEVGELTIGFNAMMKELRAKARIRETFGRYVDPRIVESIIDRPDRLAGAGERREMTVFFCDMKGFTSLSEGMTPAGMLRVVNHYLSLMSGPIRRNHGIIDKYTSPRVSKGRTRLMARICWSTPGRPNWRPRPSSFGRSTFCSWKASRTHRESSRCWGARVNCHQPW